jgi:hypothetical protein
MDVATKDDMRVWVGCLGCYNSGRLVGKWADAIDADPAEMGLAKLGDGPGYRGPFCVRCGSDEFWCLDSEGLWPFITGECSPAEAQRVAQQLDGLEAHELEVLVAYVDALGRGNWDGGVDWSDVARDAADAFVGRASSIGAWAEEFAEETGLFRGWEQYRYDGRRVQLTDDEDVSTVLGAVDWEQVGEVWTQGYSTAERDGEVWLFSS